MELILLTVQQVGRRKHDNTPSFTLVAFKIMHVNTNEWLLAAKFYIPVDFTAVQRM